MRSPIAPIRIRSAKHGRKVTWFDTDACGCGRVAAMAVIAGARRRRPAVRHRWQATWTAALVILIAPLFRLPSSPAIVIGFLVLIYSALLATWVLPAGSGQKSRRAVAQEA
jgi:hypothetical protein